MRTLSELVDVDDPAWPSITELIAASEVPVQVLAADRDRCAASLLQLQVTARSALGAVTLNTGGLLTGHGWLRVYGGGGADDAMPGIAGVNGLAPAVGPPSPASLPPEGLVIAHDVLGGVFALNGAAASEYGRPGEPGEVVYFAPDSLTWESMEGGYGAWITWLFSGSLDAFYADLRWPGWEREVAGLRPDRGISVYPFLWSGEAQADLAATSRRPVPMRELLGLHAEFRGQFGDPDPGFLGSILA